MRLAYVILAWLILAISITVPILAAMTSPLLAWRDPVYIIAGFSGIVALAILLIQPLLAAGLLPKLPLPRARHIHRWCGGILVLAVMVHVVGLWITSPPDMIDALLFRSPTPFSYLGVIAMWAVFATATLALLRRKIALRPRSWRIVHISFAVVIVAASVVHGLLIEGTMEQLSKTVLCVLIVAVTAKVVADRLLATKRTPRH